MQNRLNLKWAEALAYRISDEWGGKNDFQEDALSLKETLQTLLSLHPESCEQLIGTGIIEEDYFEKLD